MDLPHLDLPPIIPIGRHISAAPVPLSRPRAPVDRRHGLPAAPIPFPRPVPFAADASTCPSGPFLFNAVRHGGLERIMVGSDAEVVRYADPREVAAPKLSVVDDSRTSHEAGRGEGRGGGDGGRGDNPRIYFQERAGRVAQEDTQQCKK